MSSDSEEDIQIKKLLEVVDTSFLNNSMFQKNEDTVGGKYCYSDTKQTKPEFPKSQRYLTEDAENSPHDFSLPESMQKYLAHKFSELSEKHYEFHDTSENNSPKIKTKHKSRVKLLKGDNGYVSSYEDLVYDDIKGPTKKPVIERRIVDDILQQNVDDALKSVAIDGDCILSGQEVKTWAKRKERKDKVFHYKMASNGVLHPKEEINEFTQIRKKNKWNESKIKNFKKS